MENQSAASSTFKHFLKLFCKGNKWNPPRNKWNPSSSQTVAQLLKALFEKLSSRQKSQLRIKVYCLCWDDWWRRWQMSHNVCFVLYLWDITLGIGSLFDAQTWQNFALENTSDESNLHVVKRSSWSAQISKVEFQVDRRKKTWQERLNGGFTPCLNAHIS